MRPIAILVNDPSGPVSVPIVQAVVRSLAVNAAKDLSRLEAALLVAVLPNPITRDAGKPSRGVRARAQRLQRIADASGQLSACIGSAGRVAAAP